MENLVMELKEKGLLEEDEKWFIMWGKNKDLIPFTIVKSDGGFTYDTYDMATIRYRIEETKADWIIYVVDMGQTWWEAGVPHACVASCAERAGWLDPSKVRVDFVGFGVVLGEDKKKFKTRSGVSVRLTELLDEEFFELQFCKQFVAIFPASYSSLINNCVSVINPIMRLIIKPLLPKL